MRKRRRTSNLPQNRRRSIMANNDDYMSRAPDFFLLMRYDPFPTREDWEIQRQELIIIRRYQEKLNREEAEWKYFLNELKERYISLRRSLKDIMLGDPNFKYLDHLPLEARDYMIRLARDEEKLYKFKFSSVEIEQCLNLLVAKLDLLNKEYNLFVNKYKRMTEEAYKAINRQEVKNIFPEEPKEEDEWAGESEPCLEDEEF